jgi:predicted glycogen debranching enzyme
MMNRESITGQINLDSHLELEWLETNGLGSYASSTPLGCHTRKYHGLFVSALPELEGRYLLLSEMPCALVFDDEIIELSTNRYRDVFHPAGYTLIDSFHFDPCPTTTWKVGRAEITRSVLMRRGESAVYIRYSLKGQKKVSLRMRPLLSYRDSHVLTYENMYVRTRAYAINKSISFAPYDSMPSLHFQSTSSLAFKPGPFWEKGVTYVWEERRGFDSSEDRFCPGVFEYNLTNKEDLIIRVATDTVSESADIVTRYNSELKRRKKRAHSCQSETASLSLLKKRAEDFCIINARGEASVVAGYPWFGEWGRDTMIALPGLTFLGENPQHGIDVLKAYASHVVDGLLPNTLGGLQGFESYNSIDASLWYFWAVQQMVKYVGMDAIDQNLFDILESIIVAYFEGRVPVAHIIGGGLLSAGTEHSQLTWMDATAWGRPVTPRHGCAVEINALWYNALCFYDELCAVFNRECLDDAREAIVNFPTAFNRRFWLEDKGYLADVVGAWGVDSSLRPNQIFAVSLPYSVISEKRARSIVRVVNEKLVTPMGMRSLAPDDSHYRARYCGNGDERDSAYHQGTVWPWPMGHFIEAELKVSDHPAVCAEKRLEALRPLMEEHLYQAGWGGVSEIFDGSQPQLPQGCITQAWSVSELVRACTLLHKAKKS